MLCFLPLIEVIFRLLYPLHNVRVEGDGAVVSFYHIPAIRLHHFFIEIAHDGTVSNIPKACAIHDVIRVRQIHQRIHPARFVGIAHFPKPGFVILQPFSHGCAKLLRVSAYTHPAIRRYLPEVSSVVVNAIRLVGEHHDEVVVVRLVTVVTPKVRARQRFLIQPHQRLADDLQLVFLVSLADADAEALGDVLVKRGGKRGVLQRGVAGHPPGGGDLRGKVVADGVGFRLLRRRPFGALHVARNIAFQFRLSGGFQFMQGEAVSGAQVRLDGFLQLRLRRDAGQDVRRRDLYAAAGRQRLPDFAHAVGQGGFQRRHQAGLMQGVAVHIVVLDVGVFFDLLRQPAEDVRRALVQFACARGVGHGCQVGNVLFLFAAQLVVGEAGMRGHFRRSHDYFQRHFCRNRRPVGDFAVGGKLCARLARGAPACLYGGACCPSCNAVFEGVVGKPRQPEGCGIYCADNDPAGSGFMPDGLHQLPVSKDIGAAFLCLRTGCFNTICQRTAVFLIAGACAERRRKGRRATNTAAGCGGGNGGQHCPSAFCRQVSHDARVGEQVSQG